MICYISSLVPFFSTFICLLIEWISGSSRGCDMMAFNVYRFVSLYLKKRVNSYAMLRVFYELTWLRLCEIVSTYRSLK